MNIVIMAKEGYTKNYIQKLPKYLDSREYVVLWFSHIDD